MAHSRTHKRNTGPSTASQPGPVPAHDEAEKGTVRPVFKPRIVQFWKATSLHHRILFFSLSPWQTTE